MRRCLALLLAFGTSACARHVYSAPVPATMLAVTSSRSVPVARNAVSTGEAVDYLLARSLAIPVAGITVDELHDSYRKDVLELTKQFSHSLENISGKLENLSGEVGLLATQVHDLKDRRE